MNLGEGGPRGVERGDMNSVILIAYDRGTRTQQCQVRITSPGYSTHLEFAPETKLRCVITSRRSCGQTEGDSIPPCAPRQDFISIDAHVLHVPPHIADLIWDGPAPVREDESE